MRFIFTLRGARASRSSAPAFEALAEPDDGGSEADTLAWVGVVEAVIEGLDGVVEVALLELELTGFAFDPRPLLSPILGPWHCGQPVFFA